MELTITKGRGYVSADKNKTEDMPIGVIAVDSIYTPVERVNLTVENTRVGQITDFDKLTLDAVSYTHLDVYKRQLVVRHVQSSSLQESRISVQNPSAPTTSRTLFWQPSRACVS